MRRTAKTQSAETEKDSNERGERNIDERTETAGDIKDIGTETENEGQKLKKTERQEQRETQQTEGKTLRGTVKTNGQNITDCRAEIEDDLKK